MDLKIMQGAVRYLETISPDDTEYGHIREDDLLWEFVKWVAEDDGNPEIRKAAEELLKVKDCKYYRYYG